MPFSLKRLRAWHLLAGWGVYWAALILVTLGAPIGLVWRLSRTPGEHGSFSAGVDGGVAKLTVIHEGATVWSGAADLTTATLWLAGPPLLLWLLWLLLRSRADVVTPAERAATERAATERAATERAATERAATERAAAEHRGARELPAGAPAWERPAPAERDPARPRHDG